MRFLSGRAIKKQFLESRSRQSAQEFTNACALGSESADDALKVRTAIANLAEVEPDYIHAQDRFTVELAHFDFWGSLDSIAVVLELEKCLGVHISDDEASDIPDPERRSGTTVAEFVRDVLRVIRKQS